MELALLLILLVIVELVLSVWFLSRQRSYFKRIHTLEMQVSKLAEVVSSFGLESGTDDVLQVDATLLDGIGADDMAKADALLSALGYRRD